MQSLQLAEDVISQPDWNFASDEKRQPGSAIKPIIDYGPAIEYLNWSTGQTDA